MVFKKNKKIQISSEYLIIVISLIVIGVVLFSLNNMVQVVHKDYTETSIELNYEYPLSFIYTFLNYPLKKEDSNKFDKKYNINKVKDLFWMNSKESKNLIKVYKDEYIKLVLKNSFSSTSMSNSLTLFEKFSNSKKISKYDLLDFKFNILKENLPKFQNMILNKNVIIPIRTKNGEFSLIYFKKNLKLKKELINTNSGVFS